ncbi:FecR family protein [Fulvivirgaceae bacterium BMA10]|uniref:FecR family protein n=1 Tax=Splendidivirga corallicola TaxID=3051826 RepID=A0ABT8KII5_9BACT|nr:FecR family protein [Fulvivirgaceae bacterium BMA10]
MESENFQVEDFLKNEEFKRWVKNPDAESEIFWKSWMNSHPEQRENMMAAREILMAISFEAVEPEKDDYDDVLHSILKEDKRNKVSPGKHYLDTMDAPNTSRVWLRVAAVALLLLVTALIYNKYRTQDGDASEVIVTNITKSNPKGQKSMISLPDGTVLWLNSESSITYPEKFSSKDRIVKLDGEAFFEVARNVEKPFSVQVNNLEVTALGTSFNINAFPDDLDIKVSLVTGKVVVKDVTSIGNQHDAGENGIVLDPGEKLLYNRKNLSFSKAEYDYREDIAWKQGILYFNNASFDIVKRKLERWFNVKIILKNKLREEWNFSGEFQRESLDRILERIGFVEDFTFEIIDNQVLIKFN